jgi:hypothetical protein
MGPHWSLRSGCPHLKCAEDHSLHRANAVERLGEVSLSSFGTTAGLEPPSAIRAGDRGVDVVEFASRQMDHECGVPAGSGAPPRRGATRSATTAATIASPRNVAIARWPAALHADWPSACESSTMRQVIAVVNSAYSIASSANENAAATAIAKHSGARTAAERDRHRGPDGEAEDRPRGPHRDPLEGLRLLGPQHEQHGQRYPVVRQHS